MKSTDQDERKSKRQTRASRSYMKDCNFYRKTLGKVHNCSTLGLDKTLKEMATTLEDKDLLTRIAVGDLVAVEAKYHYNCLTAFNNRYKSRERRQQEDHTTSPIDLKMKQARVFAVLVSYIESRIEDGTHILKLSEIHTLFEQKLDILFVRKTINKSRLKNQLLAHLAGDCQEQSGGRNSPSI